MNKHYEEPAFPCDATGKRGMSLRAYFAGQALVLLKNTYRETPFPEDVTIVAQIAVRMADALIAELNKQ